jgi:class 3 adenylate cyclase
MEAERRQVTVLFADMVGFTSFSERSGEEAEYTLMRSLSKLMDEAVREQGDVVRGFTGDGIMAVFGAPVAFEDAPLRACRAALNILQRLKAAGSGLEALSNDLAKALKSQSRDVRAHVVNRETLSK